VHELKIVHKINNVLCSPAICYFVGRKVIWSINKMKQMIMGFIHFAESGHWRKSKNMKLMVNFHRYYHLLYIIWNLLSFLGVKFSVLAARIYEIYIAEPTEIWKSRQFLLQWLHGTSNLALQLLCRR